MSGSNIAVTTTFPNFMWDTYAKAMLLGFVKYWPKDIPLLVNLDDDLLFDEVRNILREDDGVCCGWSKEHFEFVERNKDKDDKDNYRKQAVRFCHKPFALKHTLDCIEEAKKSNAPDVPRYLIWMDADVITTSQVTEEALRASLPKNGDEVAYLGREDWDHSECGWLAFDLENSGGEVIESLYQYYVTDDLYKLEQWHDSYIFDQIAAQKTNLTEGKPGMDIWQHSPMAAFSVHHKGPVAKSVLQGLKQPKNMGLRIETKNSLPNDTIHQHIKDNQQLINNWIRTCSKTDEEIIVVSAGPMLNVEEILKEHKAGKKIVAVKHAIKPLKEAGITPWACILLDPRPHVNAFVENPDTSILWFVASQVDPGATKTLIYGGCEVWGYHAAVGADEDSLTKQQPDAIVTGGSATATRGLYLLDKLGFHKFRLYGYDLCLPTKPDMKEKDELGQMKHYEVSIASNHLFHKATRMFWSTAELLAQYQEMNEIFQRRKWDIEAFGHGIVPFMSESKRIGDLRERLEKRRLGSPVSYKELLGCKKRTLLGRLLKQ